MLAAADAEEKLEFTLQLMLSLKLTIDRTQLLAECQDSDNQHFKELFTFHFQREFHCSPLSPAFSKWQANRSTPSLDFASPPPTSFSSSF